MEKVAQEKSFLNMSDALDWFELTIFDWDSSYWKVDEGTCIRYVNGGWQVFIQLKKVR